MEHLMKTKEAKLQSESCVEEFLIIIKLRLKLLLRRLGETEGTDIIKAEDSTSSPEIKTTPKNEVRMEAVLYSEPRPAPDCAPRRLVRWFSAGLARTVTQSGDTSAPGTHPAHA